MMKDFSIVVLFSDNTFLKGVPLRFSREVDTLDLAFERIKVMN